MDKKWRYLGQQCLNSFVLTNLNLIETPTIQEAIKNNLSENRNIIQEQIFLQESGVSFSYTDSICYQERKELVDEMIKYLEIKNKKIQESINSSRSQ